MSSSGFGSKTKAQLIDRILGKKMRSGGRKALEARRFPAKHLPYPKRSPALIGTPVTKK